MEHFLWILNKIYIYYMEYIPIFILKNILFNFLKTLNKDLSVSIYKQRIIYYNLIAML